LHQVVQNKRKGKHKNEFGIEMDSIPNLSDFALLCRYCWHFSSVILIASNYVLHWLCDMQALPQFGVQVFDAAQHLKLLA
jgi:hypothetical protein